MSGRATRAAWLFAALLAVAVAAALAWPDAEAVPVRPAPLPRAAAGASPAEPAASYAAVMLARPLFTPDRRPDVADTGPAPAARDRPEPPRLTGILVTSAGRSAIFAALGGGGRATVVNEGGSLGRWRVAAIHAGDVQLAGPEGLRTVRPAYSDAPLAVVAGGQLPQLPQPDTRTVSSPAFPGLATLPNAPVSPAARTSP